jgi:hypothetical protein
MNRNIYFIQLMDFPKFFIYNNDSCYFSDTEIVECSFKCKIMLRESYNRSLILLGTIKKEYVLSPQINKEIVAVCKSNLQKCIRRNKTVKAVKTAFALLSIDPVAFLRRLPMILIEDSLPFFSLIKVVWWMIAVGKGYKLCQEEIEELMGIVFDASENKFYEKCNFKNIYDIKEKKYKDFFLMLELRRLYSGMPQDLKMINYHIELWCKKFKEIKWVELLKPEHTIIDLDKIEKFSKNDILLESIDYHCYPWILDKLVSKDYDLKLSRTKIRDLIWNFRSGINLKQSLFTIKKEISKEEKQQFEKIKNDLDNLSIWILENSIIKNIV